MSARLRLCAYALLPIAWVSGGANAAPPTSRDVCLAFTTTAKKEGFVGPGAGATFKSIRSCSLPHPCEKTGHGNAAQLKERPGVYYCVPALDVVRAAKDGEPETTQTIMPFGLLRKNQKSWQWYANESELER